MRAGPLDHEDPAWHDIKPIANYGKDGRLNMWSIKLFMDGSYIKPHVTEYMLIKDRCIGILGCRSASPLL